ncbi:hypothetical protein HHK36_023740 [Tetracentron sinense]|uniref:Uncharacterized protein n=1 Tax=Tetracentron sinense TaxID=13715 RepID=A0A834YPB4_TETSI|nr:hypothetical protein HHK36_023740 [Tetracentron sinense]
MKTGDKNKFLHCFRPIAMEGPNRPIFTCIAVEKLMIPAILPSLSEKETSKVSERETPGRRPKRNARRLFSRIRKALMFKTSLTRKVRNRKGKQDSDWSESSLMAKSENISDVTDDKLVRQKLKIDSMVSSLSSSTLISSSSFSSSGSSSSTVSTSPISESENFVSLSDRKESFRSNSLGPKQSKTNLQDPRRKTKEKATGNYSSNAGLYLLLISLSILIFWGRICAIVCTSTCLYFAPRWNSGDRRPENVMKVVRNGLLKV